MPTDIHKFERECLEAHNNFRAQHGCPPLKLNRTLSAQSREWAENLAKRKIMENSSGHNFGENLYMAEGIHVDGARPVKAWYDEIEDYDFEAAKFVQGAGHFTQLIWKTTTDLGVGVATNDKLTLVVAYYFRPGNQHGKFKENVPPRIDQENIKPSFSEDNGSIGSNFLDGTINIVLPKTLTTSTRISKDFYDRYKSHELTIPIEMVSTATSPRVSIKKEVPRSSAQIVLQISNDGLATTETRNSAKELDTNKTDRNSITVKDMHYIPPPSIETAKRGRRTSSSGRTMLFRASSNIVLGSNEPSNWQSVQRQESRSSKERNMAYGTETARQEDSILMPPPKPPGRKIKAKQEPRSSQDHSLVHKTTSTDEFGRLEEPSILYRTFSNIIIGSQEQHTPQSYTENNTTGITRQDSMPSKERNIVNTNLIGRLEPRFSKDRDIVYRTTPSPETTWQEQPSANDRSFLYSSISNIVLDNQEQNIPQPYQADIRPDFTRQDSISPKKREMKHVSDPRTEISGQQQNREMTTTTAFVGKTIKQEPGLSKYQDVVQRTTPATETERQERISANERKFLYRTNSNIVVSNQKLSTRQPIRRQDSISSKERDMSHKTEIARQEQNREMETKTSVRTQNVRQESGPSKGPEMLYKTTPVHEAEEQQRPSANDRKYLYKKSSNMNVQSEEQTSRQLLRRQDSMSPRGRDIAHKTETKTLIAQTVRQEPGPSTLPDMVQKPFPTHGTERQTSVNNKNWLESREQTTQQQQSNLAKAESMPPHVTALRNEIARQVKNKEIPPKTTLSIETARKDSIASKSTDVAHVMALRNEIANQEHIREMKARQTGRQEPKTPNKQDMLHKTPRTNKTDGQEAESSKHRDMGHTTTRTGETVRQGSTVKGHKNVSQTKIPRPETGKHESRAFSNKDVSQTKILRSDSGRLQSKASTSKDVSQTKIPRLETAKRETKAFTNIDVSHTKTSKTEVGGMESKTSGDKVKPYSAPIFEAHRQEEEPTTSTRSGETKGQEPTTQTGPSTERLRKSYEFSHADQLFHHECLLAHNCYRAKHGSPPLQLCEQLTLYATRWAQELAVMDKLLYSPTEDLGENIYVAAGIRITGYTPVKAWYNEVEDYDFKKAQFTPYTGHFTQVVWKDTRELGVGVIKNEKCCIVVASYFPPGNETGQFKDNVLPSRGCICDTEPKVNNSSSNGSSNNSSNSSSNSSNNSSSNRSNSTRSSNRLFNLGLLVSAMAAAVGGWIIYNKPFLN